MVAQHLNFLSQSYQHLAHGGLYRCQHVCHAEARYHVYHSLIRHLRHIIDYRHAILLYTHLCHIRAKSIYAYSSIGTLAPYHLKGHAQAPHLFFFRYIPCSGAGRIGTNIYYCTTLSNYLVGTTGYISLSLHSAASKKRVGRGIEDTHHLRHRQIQQTSVYIDAML